MAEDITFGPTNQAGGPITGSTGTYTGEVTAADFKATGLTGANALTSRYVGTTAGGPPLTGTFAVNDWIISIIAGTYAGMWACVTAGSPGTWMRVNEDPELLTAGESTIARDRISSQVTMSTTALRLGFFTARKTEACTAIRVNCATGYSGAAPTLIRFGAYSVAANGDLTLVASTPNDTALLASNATAYSKALSAGFSKTVGQRYALGVLVVTAGTAPIIYGTTLPLGSEMGLSPRLCGLVGGQTDLPASVVAASVGDTGNRPYVVVG